MDNHFTDHAFTRNDDKYHTLAILETQATQEAFDKSIDDQNIYCIFYELHNL